MAILGAFMVPHPPLILAEVGRGNEKQVQETITAYEEIAERIAKLKPETIVISSPHSIMYADYCHVSPGNGAGGSFESFGAPQVRFEEEYDRELTGMIDFIARQQDVSCGIMGEKNPALDHGTMVPLYFIRKKYTNFKLVRIGLSEMDPAEHYRVGKTIQEAADKVGRKIVFVASGDWSHKLQEYGPYGFAKEGPIYDQKLIKVCKKADFLSLLSFDETLCNKAAECGQRSFLIMAGALDGIAVKPDFLSYQDVTGVGYGICAYEIVGQDDNRCFLDKYLQIQQKRFCEQLEKTDVYVKLAYRSIYEYLFNRRVLSIEELIAKEDTQVTDRQGQNRHTPDEELLSVLMDCDKYDEELLHDRAGVFVSIHKFGLLRGCIGTIAPTTENIASEILQNAISAAVKDPRFSPIDKKEFQYLEINVDVLQAPESIASKDELDVKEYGVIVTSGHKRGLLLPNLDGVDTVEQQIAIAMQKAGIEDGEPIKRERFKVTRHL